MFKKLFEDLGLSDNAHRVYLQLIENGTCSTVIVSGVLSNPEYKPFVAVVPFSEKYSWLLNTVLVFLIIFIAFLIFGYVRKVMRAGQLG